MRTTGTKIKRKSEAEIRGKSGERQAQRSAKRRRGGEASGRDEQDRQPTGAGEASAAQWGPVEWQTERSKMKGEYNKRKREEEEGEECNVVGEEAPRSTQVRLAQVPWGVQGLGGENHSPNPSTSIIRRGIHQKWPAAHPYQLGRPVQPEW